MLWLWFLLSPKNSMIKSSNQHAKEGITTSFNSREALCVCRKMININIEISKNYKDKRGEIKLFGSILHKAGQIFPSE